MTSPKGTGKIINIKCTEVSLPEFPNLLFGTHFDGRYYLQSQDPDNKLSIEDFFHKFDFQIKAIAETYKLPLEKLVSINTEGHQLIDGCLCYPFLSYVDPQFCAYINEMFVTGVVVSDTHLISLVKKRLPPELLKQIWDGREDFS